MKKKFIFLYAFLWVILATGSIHAQDYIVGEGDVLKITVYDHEDLTQTVRVGGDGAIMVSLLGQVPVQGLSVTKVAQKITALYADGYLVDPQVNVFIEEFRSRKATILGQVAQPGLYELRHHTTLLELISQAGGLTEDAGDLATIKRKNTAGGESHKIITIDLKELIENGNTQLNMPIEAGDNIYIQKADMVYVSGEVKKPGVYKCFSDTSVIKVITIAGGFTDKAAPTKVKLIRKVDGTEQVLEKVAMDLIVSSDDVIVVPESFF